MLRRLGSLSHLSCPYTKHSRFWRVDQLFAATFVASSETPFHRAENHARFKLRGSGSFRQSGLGKWLWELGLRQIQSNLTFSSLRIT